MSPTTRIRGGNLRKKQAKRIPSYVWESHKAEIESLWLEQYLTQVQVVEHLSDHFRVTKRQLVHQLKKWGFWKYKISSLRTGEAMAAVIKEDFRVEHQMATDGVLPRHSRALPPPTDRGEDAEAHFAISDDSAAWTLCMNSYAATSRRGQDHGALDSTVIVLARSARTQRQATETGKMLDGILKTALSREDNPVALKCRLLKAHMQVRNRDSINEVLDGLDLDLEDLARNIEGADFLTVHLLRALSSYAKITEPPYSFSNDGFLALQSCISWSTRQLETLTNMPIQLFMVGREQDTEPYSWREETELFFTLWHRWQKSRWDQPEWAREAETKLGITAAELLATVSCMVLEAFVDVSDDDEDDSEEDGVVGDASMADSAVTEDESVFQSSNEDKTHQEQLLGYAREGAQDIGGWDKEDIWEVFSETFDSRNTLDEVGSPAWAIEASGYIGGFIDATLAEGAGA